MAVIRTLTEDGTWAYISVDGSNADTLDGMHASEFVTTSDIATLAEVKSYLNIQEGNE